MSFHFALRSSSALLKKIAFAAAFLTVLTSTALHASSITYNLTLTPGDHSTIGGSGSFTIEGAPAASGNSEFSIASGNLDALTFNIGGQTFSLAGDTDAFVVFQNGKLYDITFAQELNGQTTDNRYDLQTTSGYSFYYDNENSRSTGTFSVSDSSTSSPVPEPGSLALLATGLFGGAGSLYRRFASRS
jgi:hypothetical protein